MASSPLPSIKETDSPLAWLTDDGDCLYRYALYRVRRPEVAEDLVQDALLAALRSAERFQGKSSRRSWLIGILKNKIFDYYRKLGREQTFTDLQFPSEGEEDRFDEIDHWREDLAPRPWPVTSVEALDKEAFWSVLQSCLGKLPKRVADVFLLREMEEQETREICQSLAISPNHLWVMLHRARAGLRGCLEENWFVPENKR